MVIGICLNNTVQVTVEAERLLTVMTVIDRSGLYSNYASTAEPEIDLNTKTSVVYL